MNNEKIGKFIASRRKELKLTQKQLADQLHVTDKAISKWETGAGCPDVSILGELSQALDVGIGEILNGQYDEKLKDNNKFILDAVNYSKENTTKKIYKRISFSLTFIMGTLCIYMLVMGIYQTYYFSKPITYQIASSTMEDINKNKQQIMDKINKITTWKTDVYTEEEIKEFRFSFKLHKATLNEFINKLEQNFSITHTEYKELYNYSLHVWTYSSVYAKFASNHDLKTKPLFDLNSKVLTKIYIDKSYATNVHVYGNKTFDYDEYKYKSIDYKINFEEIMENISLYFENMNIVLDRMIEVGEYYE